MFPVRSPPHIFLQGASLGRRLLLRLWRRLRWQRLRLGAERLKRLYQRWCRGGLVRCGRNGWHFLTGIQFPKRPSYKVFGKTRVKVFSWKSIIQYPHTHASRTPLESEMVDTMYIYKNWVFWVWGPIKVLPRTRKQKIWKNNVFLEIFPDLGMFFHWQHVFSLSLHGETLRIITLTPCHAASWTTSPPEALVKNSEAKQFLEQWHEAYVKV